MSIMFAEKDRYNPETKAAYDKTFDEVNSGCMRGPFTADQIQEKYGDYFNVTGRFGIQQGLKEKKGSQSLSVLDTFKFY